MKRNICLYAVVVALAACIGPSGLQAQTNTGTIVGTVTDPTGAVIPGARVLITNTNLQNTTELRSNAAGAFVAPALRAGPYEVRVEAAGFQAFVRRNLILNVNDRLAVEVQLQPGAVTETIEVTTATPLLNTESGDVSSVIDSRSIQDLPLDGRSYIDLMLLAPGVLQAPNLRGNPREGRFTVNGANSLQNYFVLNGVDNNSFTQNAQDRSPQVGRPAPDALQEFKIQTRTYTAEFGWALGGVINAQIKSGSNQFRGSAWWFHRNDNLNATDFFINRAGGTPPEQKRNQWGFTAGGPIWRDHTFWFFDYENTQASEGTTATGTTPTALWRQGDFSERVVSFDAAALANFMATVPEELPCLVLDDPVTPTRLLGLNLTATRTDGLPCGDPAGLALVALYPTPTGPGLFDYVAAPNIPNRQNRFDIRVDHQLTNRDNIYGVYDFFDQETIVERGAFPNPLATGGFSGVSDVRTHVLALAWVHTFSPSVVNEARFGFNYVYSTTDPLAPAGDACPDYNFPNCPGAFAYGLPAFRPISGYTELGTNPWRPQNSRSQVWQAIDNLSYVRGSHQLKFGFEWKRAINNFLDIRAPNGEIYIPNWWTNDGIANLLLGNARRAIVTSPLVPHTYVDGTMFYAQDSWRATPELTINYGIRYEYFTPVIERDRLTSNFDPTAAGGRGALVTAIPGSLPAHTCTFDCFLAGPSGDSIYARTLIHPDRNNFAPRLGVAYQVRDRIVLRGGYAIFYQAKERFGSDDILQLNPPQFFEVTLDTSSSAPPSFYLRDGFPISATPPATIDPTALGLRGQDPDQTSPWSQQWSFGPQIELTNDISLEIVYVGQDSNDLRRWRNINQGILSNVVPGVSGTVTRPFPDFGNLSSFMITDGSATYHALQTNLRKRFSHGIMFNAAYTWGKALGNTGDNLTGGGQVRAQNAHDLVADYGPLQSDQAHRLVVNWVWELPFGPGQPYLNEGPAAKILGDWQITGVTSHTSGVPLTVGASDLSNTNAGTMRADCVGSASSTPRGLDTYGSLYSGTTAFAQPLAYTFGNCGVGILRGWPHHNWDVGLFKKARIDENRWFEFRVEFFNIWNTPQFNDPNTSITSANIGRTTSVLDPEKPARVIQMGLKFIWD
jgi:hypothetical protein